jgi:hypothetical protein
MSKLTNTDLHYVVSRLPKDIAKLIKDFNLIVAGGFIRETISGGIVSDIDVFGSDECILQAAAKELESKREGCRKFATKNAITILSPPRLPVQFILRWVFPDRIFCIDSFDFTVCQAAIWFDTSSQTWQSIIADDFYPDLAAKRLVYTYPQRDEDAGGSMLRIRKFIQRGYSIQSLSMAGVISRLVSKIEWRGQDEKSIAIQITGLLREVDPLTIVDGIELVDEHKEAN